MKLEEKIIMKNLSNVWISTVLLCSLLAKTVMSVDPVYEACQPRNCGFGPNISYPFYVESAGADYCGLRGFRITCQQDKPMIMTSRGPYVVEEISYENQSIRLVDSDVVNSTCFAPKHYFAFDYPPLRFSSSHVNLQFFYGCNESFPLDSEKSVVPCASNASHLSFVTLTPTDEEILRNLEVSYRYCNSEVSVPVDLEGYWQTRPTIKALNYTELQRNGFTLVWYGDTCGNCETTGGRCAFRNNETACFCPDGASNSTSCNLQSGSHESPPKHVEKSVPVAIIPGVPIIAAVLAVLGVVIAILCCLRKNSTCNAFVFLWKKRDKSNQSFDALLRINGPIQVKRYSYREIKKITKGFSEELGQGGFGRVYKGKLDDGCSHVAVKVWNRTKGEDGEEIVNEVAAISRTSHVNVVTLLGFCFDGAKRALVYEYMPNGSLEKFIFRETETESKCLLDWVTLYRIALGIARGLEYLHRGCNSRILHMDIKPHNILLDAEFVPKISDFGLAKICAKRESTVSALGPRGTVGYIAPEVFSRNFGGISYKSDVYSYGVMILEMVGGRKNIDVRTGYTSEIYFPRWIYKRLELDEDQLGLKRVVGNEEDRVMVRKMILTSMWCIQTVPPDRPTMSRVIEMLEGSLDSLPVPPKPFLSSPQPSSSPTASSSMF